MPIIVSPRGRRPKPGPPPPPARVWRRLRAILTAALRWLTTGELRQAIGDAVDEPSRAAAAALDLVPWGDLTGPLTEALAGVVAPAFEEAAKAVADELAGGARDVAHPFQPADALEWARRYAAGRVVEITEETRAVIRETVERGLEDGRSVDAVAADVRQVIGLHARWATAVSRYARAVDADPSLNPAQRRGAVDAYRNRLLDRRARNIAHTELLTAAAAGRLAGYELAAASGALTGPVEKVWLTAHDERICKVCLPLNGVVVQGLEGGWPTARGGVLHPPAHPSCRCTFIVRPSTVAKQAGTPSAWLEVWERGRQASRALPTAQTLAKALSPKDRASVDAETARIKVSREGPGAKPHPFKPAKWTHPNGHPRCRVCGAEQHLPDGFDTTGVPPDDWPTALCEGYKGAHARPAHR